MNEFKSALRETTRDSNEEHFQDVQNIVNANPADEERIKQQLQKLS